MLELVVLLECGFKSTFSMQLELAVKCYYTTSDMKVKQHVNHQILWSVGIILVRRIMIPISCKQPGVVLRGHSAIFKFAELDKICSLRPRIGRGSIIFKSIRLEVVLSSANEVNQLVVFLKNALSLSSRACRTKLITSFRYGFVILSFSCAFSEIFQEFF